MQCKNPKTSKIPVEAQFLIVSWGYNLRNMYTKAPHDWFKQEIGLLHPRQFACRLHFRKRRSANKDSVAVARATTPSQKFVQTKVWKRAINRPTIPTLSNCFQQCLWVVHSCDSLSLSLSRYIYIFMQSYFSPANHWVSRSKPLKNHVPFDAGPWSLNVQTRSPGQSFGSTLQTTQCRIQCLIKVLHSGPWCKKFTNILW